jgi:hypothetical protein
VCGKEKGARAKIYYFFAALSGCVIIIFIHNIFVATKTSEWVSWFRVKVLAVVDRNILDATQFGRESELNIFCGLSFEN